MFNLTNRHLLNKALKYHQDFIKDIPVRFFLICGLFLAICIAINFSIDFEDNYLESFAGQKVYSFLLILYYAVPYFFVVFTYSLTSKEFKHFRNFGFWVFSIAILSALSFNQTVYYAYKEFIDSGFASEIQYFIKLCTTKFTAPLVIAGIAYIHWNRYDRKDMNFYGFKSSSYSAYAYMLAGMAPVIIAVSFLPDFIKFYPMYKSGSAETYWGVSRWITFPVYEFCYGSSFLGIELLFRGFFVLALMRYMGKAAVFPMVAVYCFYHFGKPMGEAIGSIFGGYILGIIAYYSRSIIGGFLLHAGIAFIMDISAIWQHVSRDEW